MASSTNRLIFLLCNAILLVVCMIFLSGCGGMTLTDSERQQYFTDAVLAYDMHDYSRAYRLWIHLANDHNVSAMVNLGIMYAQGRGVRQDIKTARKWYERAARLGFAAAQLRLADLIRDEDADAARHWDNLAKVSGHPLGIYRMARYLSVDPQNMPRVCDMMMRVAAYDLQQARDWLAQASCSNTPLVVTKTIDKHERRNYD